MKKQLLPNAIMFLLICLFITGFTSVFGEEQSIVGVIAIVTGLSLTQVNLTKNPLSQTIGLVVIHLWMGLAAFIGQQASLLSVIVNGVTIFALTYTTVRIHKPLLHFPFLLGYVFLIFSAPLQSATELPMRLISLTVAALFIVGLQLLFNGKRYEKTMKHETMELVTCIETKLQMIMEQRTQTESVNFHTSMTKAMQNIDDYREKARFLLPKSKQYVSVFVALERLYYVLDDEQIKHGHEQKEWKQLQHIVQLLKKNVENVENVDDEVKKSLHNLAHYSALSPSLQEALQLLEYSLQKRAEKQFTQEGLLSHLKNHRPNDFAYRFASRMALSLSIATFFIQYFELEYGRWFIFTLLALITPQFEESVHKTKHRLAGTTIGIVVIIIAFSFIQSPLLQMMMVLFAGYMDMFSSLYSYAYKMTWVTIQSVGSVVMVAGFAGVLDARLLYIVLGAVFAYGINRYLFPITERMYRTFTTKEHRRLLTYIRTTSTDTTHDVYDAIVRSYLVVSTSESTCKKHNNVYFSALKQMMT